MCNVHVHTKLDLNLSTFVPNKKMDYSNYVKNWEPQSIHFASPQAENQTLHRRVQYRYPIVGMKPTSVFGLVDDTDTFPTLSIP